MYKNRENTRINLSKTSGIGVRCARVSVNKKGV
jgi:hypothetical protein